MRFNSLNSWSLFEKGLLLINLAISMMFLVIGKDYSTLALIGFVANISNVVCVILTAKKKISNFWWGLVGVITYIVVSYAYTNTGEWMLNLFYYLPMNTLGLIMWKKHSEDKINIVSKALNKKQILATAIITIVCTIVYAWFISLTEVNEFLYPNAEVIYNFPRFLIASFCVIASVIGMVLLVKQYREQWLLWIAVDILTIITWIITFEPTMILLWATMLTNACYGYIMWSKNVVKSIDGGGAC